jgi:hypothetical protein
MVALEVRAAAIHCCKQWAQGATNAVLTTDMTVSQGVPFQGSSNETRRTKLQFFGREVATYEETA